MAHPDGGRGNTFPTRNRFRRVYESIGLEGREFRSTTGEVIFAKRGHARAQTTPTVVFIGERHRHGSACETCWGFRISCNGERIGQCSEAIDREI